MGERPDRCFRKGLRSLPPPIDTLAIAEALCVHKTAKVRKDATFSANGILYEVRGRHFAGKTLQLRLDPFTKHIIDVSHKEEQVPFSLCDIQKNAKRGRGEEEKAKPSKDNSRFNRISQVLQAARKVTDAS